VPGIPFPSLEKLREGSMLLVDKPLDWTSADVVRFVRSRLYRRVGDVKVGHAGTLDPKATGLLLLCTGAFTKQIDHHLNQSKTYTGTFKLGATTPCYDTEKEEDAWFPTEHITPERLEAARRSFLGEQMQRPPIFSAIKVGGKKMYKKARSGTATELEPRAVTIHRFEITDVRLPEVDFAVECSKGTYIRSLAHDFGRALDSGGYLWALRRTAIGDLSVEDAHSPEAFGQYLETLG
jgi:tRNA pseudouridine55 synthase